MLFGKMPFPSRKPLALAALVGALLALAEAGRQLARQPQTPHSCQDHRDPVVWLQYKEMFNKTYASHELEALHRTVFVRRLDVRCMLSVRCKTGIHYPWNRLLDEARSTWAMYAEPTVSIFIRNYQMKFGRNYGSVAERKLRHQLIELFLDHRRLFGGCCRVAYKHLVKYEDETVDRTLDEIAQMGKDNEGLNRVEFCDNESSEGPI